MLRIITVGAVALTGAAWALTAAGFGWYIIATGIGLGAGFVAGACARMAGTMTFEVFKDARVQTWRPGRPDGMHSRSYDDE